MNVGGRSIALLMSVDGHEPFDGQTTSGHAVIAGFGVPGRAVADALAAQNRRFVVIELNPSTIDRCSHRGIHMIEGDVRNAETLRRAGIERASFFAVTVPNDQIAMEAVRLARELNPTMHIMARLHFISNGMIAHKTGANEVVNEEQVVAQEFVRLIKNSAPELQATTV
jgi:monovalent cation:H+ antiporter-2, CPA2 family